MKLRVRAVHVRIELDVVDDSGKLAGTKASNVLPIYEADLLKLPQFMEYLKAHGLDFDGKEE